MTAGVDTAGKNVFGKRFLFCYPFHEGVAAVIIKGTGTQVINRRGESITELHILSVNGIVASEGLVAVATAKEDRWGFIDVTGRVVIPPRYQQVGNFCEGAAAVCLHGKWGYVDHSGRSIVPPTYDNARKFSGGVASVAVGEKWGCINRDGQWVIQPKFEQLKDCREGMIVAKSQGKWGAVDRGGNVAISMSYDDMGDFSEGLVAARLARGWGFLDRSGKRVVPFDYYSTEPFREGLAKIGMESPYLNGPIQYRYISQTGAPVGPIYESARSFSEGLAQIASEDKGWFINHGGKTVFELPRGGLRVPEPEQDGGKSFHREKAPREASMPP